MAYGAGGCVKTFRLLMNTRPEDAGGLPPAGPGVGFYSLFLFRNTMLFFCCNESMMFLRGKPKPTLLPSVFEF